MNITLTPEQSRLIEQKLQSGRYQNIDDLLIQAFQLLDDWEEHSLTESPDWVAATRTKVDAAIASIAANGGNDGEAAISQLLDRFRQAREASQ
ncbi:type II toxin-antitoxin system ParD family antitoxin [Chamaesiphon sp.]|uniref:ribbon-helix-helix domain-containing protein n=1 Tax=Chamaesiphon sp. TaxID=2814140 RepID=UPI00359325DC